MNGIRRAMVEGKVLYNVILNVDFYSAMLMRRILYRNNPVKKNKIVFMTFDRDYTCNPKYIAEEILRQNLDMDLVWITARETVDSTHFPQKIRLVNYGSAEMFEEMATAKVWIDNALTGVWHNMPKKKNQIYLNTWHGSLGIKKLSGDSRWLRTAARCNKATDYCITNSTFEENVFRTTFWADTPVLRLGHARNDILINPDQTAAARKKVLEYYGLSEDTKIAMYAPTFRDNGNTQVYNISFQTLKQSLAKRFGGNWVIFERAHFKNRASQVPHMEKDVINVSSYPDMQELMAAADAGVTDYSSWAYDYILTGKPVFIYAPDLSAYAGGRGFYYPIETTPFAIAETNEQLSECIEQFDADQYEKDVKAFLEDKGCYEKGNAAAEIVSFLKEKMEL